MIRRAGWFLFGPHYLDAADSVLDSFDTVLQEHVPGAKGQPHREFPNGGYFIQAEEPDASIETVLAA